MINVLITSDPKYQINKLAIQSAVLGVLQTHRVSGDIEVSISIVGDRKMHEINKRYRGIDSTTNILSFALEDALPQNQLQHVPRIGFVKAPDKVLRLGDIVLSYPQIIKDASIEGVSVEEELRYLIEHGTQHLLGIHH